MSAADNRTKAQATAAHLAKTSPVRTQSRCPLCHSTLSIMSNDWLTRHFNSGACKPRRRKR